MNEDEKAKLLDIGNGFIQTYTGKIVEPLNLKKSDVDIADIAHGLSNICRFCGHSAFFYSVAQHSILGAGELLNRTGEAKTALSFLLHDASEAYICDIPRPLKRLPEFKKYLGIEESVQNVICGRFGVNIHQDIVKEMDKIMLATEKRDLMRNSPDRVWSYLPQPVVFKIGPMLPETCESLFLSDFDKYNSEG
jgi:hypothetical protein